MPKPIKDERSPYWQFDFQRNKRRFYGSTGCTTKRKAQEYIDRLVERIAAGTFDKADITLDEACNVYWLNKGQHESSRATTEYQLANLCIGLGKDRPLRMISLADFRQYVAKRRVKVSNASVNREWQLARRVWKYVESDHSVSQIRWGDLKLSEDAERVRELRADEEARLFEALPDNLKPIVQFAILSGQRKSAVVGLRWDAIDWHNGLATITNKGGSPHTFPLSPAMVELILEQPVVDGCPFVFTYVCERPSPKRKDRPARHKGERYPFSQQGWNRKWRNALAEAEITDFRFHDLRHTTATRLLRATGNIKAAGTLLGHTDIRTTSRYAHINSDDLRRMMSAAQSRNSHGEK